MPLRLTGLGLAYCHDCNPCTGQMHGPYQRCTHGKCRLNIEQPVKACEAATLCRDMTTNHPKPLIRQAGKQANKMTGKQNDRQTK
jgi:hypothetical protein